jgi:hypothetical protein
VGWLIGIGIIPVGTSRRREKVVRSGPWHDRSSSFSGCRVRMTFWKGSEAAGREFLGRGGMEGSERRRAIRVEV